MISALFLSLALFQAPQQAAPPMGSLRPLADEKLEKGTIEGRVISAVDGLPLKKANVMLLPQSQPGSITRPLSTITEADGKFLFKDLDPGPRYTINVVRNGYARQNYGQRLPNGPGTALSLSPGQHLKDINVRLTPGAAINGRIVDEDNDPVAGAYVRTMRWGFMNGKRQLMPGGGATTDDRGQYRVYGIAPGRYYVSATYQGPNFMMVTAGESSPKESEEAYAPTYYPGVLDASQASAVDLKGGDDISGVVFRLVRARAVRISGIVRNANGESAKSAMVQMFPRPTGMMNSGPNMRMTDDKGAFTFTGIMPGAYALIVRGTIDDQQMFGRADIDVGTSPLDNVLVNASTGAELEADVHLDGPVDLSKGAVRLYLSPDETMLPVPGSTVQLKEGASTVTFTKVYDGNYNLRAAGLADDSYLSKAVFDEKDVTVEPLKVHGGGKLDITISSNGAHLEGSVFDKDHQPVTSATVVLVPEESRRSRLDLFRTANSDQYGHYVLRGIPPGTYKIFAWEAIDYGAYQDPDFLKSYEDQGRTLQLAPGERSSPELKVIPVAKTGS